MKPCFTNQRNAARYSLQHFQRKNATRNKVHKIKLASIITFFFYMTLVTGIVSVTEAVSNKAEVQLSLINSLFLLCGLILLVLFFKRFRYNAGLFTLAIGLLLSFLLIAVDCIFIKSGWAVLYVLPAILLLHNVLILLFYKNRGIMLQDYVLYFLAANMLCFIPIILYRFGLTELIWIPVVLAVFSLANICIVLIRYHSILRNELKKRLYL